MKIKVSRRKELTKITPKKKKNEIESKKTIEKKIKGTNIRFFTKINKINIPLDRFSTE